MRVDVMRVLLAIDGSPESLNAAEFLAMLPFHEKPHVVVVSVLVETQFDIAIAESGIQLREVERETAHQHYATVSAALDKAGMPSEQLLLGCHRADAVFRHSRGTSSSRMD